MMPDGAVGIDEDLVGDAADVGFRDLVDAVDRAEQFAPVAIASLVGGELRGQSFVVGEAANQIGLAAGLDHLQFVVADVFFFQTLNFGVDGVAISSGLCPGSGTAINANRCGYLMPGYPVSPSEKDAIFLSRTRAR